MMNMQRMCWQPGIGMTTAIAMILIINSAAYKRSWVNGALDLLCLEACNDSRCEADVMTKAFFFLQR